MSVKQIVVIGASSGGIDAVRTVLSGLPETFPAPVCVVIHTSANSPGVLHDILGRASAVPVLTANDGQRLQPGRAYLAPPDFHLLVEPGKLAVRKGPRENRFRPAVDPLFRSAAQVYGPGAIGVLLTGDLDDGSAGLWTIKHLGGVAIVQNPVDAQFPEMPRNALKVVTPDYLVSVGTVASLLGDLMSRPIEDRSAIDVPTPVDIEVNIAKGQNALEAGIGRIGTPSIYTCPECHGVLLQVPEGRRARFRCHTGHAYSPESLLASINEGIEESLWNSVRVLEEGGLLLRRMAEHLTLHANDDVDRIVTLADETFRQRDILRDLLAEREPLP